MLVADDEPAARRGVRQLIQPYAAFTVVAECRDGAEVLRALDDARPDVVFLDVQMPGLDGFDVIRHRTVRRMPVVVFLTAYEQFAIRAFEAEALDYLLKPVTEKRFAATMDRLERQLVASRGVARGALDGGVLVIPTSRGATVLPVGEVEWIEAADNYARVWARGRSYLLREPLRALEQRVRSSGFVRAHRSALVRVECVRRLAWTAERDLVAVLASGERVPVSRRRRATFVAAVRSLGADDAARRATP